MSDMLKTIEPKSDQLNADDLIGGRTLTIEITSVSILAGDQPVALNYKGDNGKPWKPCKSMRRVLVSAWGSDGNKYVGRRVTLYRDEKVKFGGAEVGGIRISHMSDIDGALTVALTASRAIRKPYTVQPLAGPAAEPSRPKPPTATELLAVYEACATQAAFDDAEKARKAIWKSLDKETASKLKAASDAAAKRIAEAAASEQHGGQEEPPSEEAADGDQGEPPADGSLFGEKPQTSKEQMDALLG